MNRFMDDGYGPGLWTLDLALSAGQEPWFKPLRTELNAPSIDQEDGAVPVTRTIGSGDPFELAEQVGRYLRLIETADGVEKAGSYVPLPISIEKIHADLPLIDFQAPFRLYDPVFDEFYLGIPGKNFLDPGFLGSGPRWPPEVEPGRALLGPAPEVHEDPDDAFVSLPDGEPASAVPFADWMEAEGFNGPDATFHGGADLDWMLNQLPSPDQNNNDAWFANPMSIIDPWG
jgi:hypothetical protein